MYNQTKLALKMWDLKLLKNNIFAQVNQKLNSNKFYKKQQFSHHQSFEFRAKMQPDTRVAISFIYCINAALFH